MKGRDEKEREKREGESVERDRRTETESREQREMRKGTNALWRKDEDNVKNLRKSSPRSSS